MSKQKIFTDEQMRLRALARWENEGGTPKSEAESHLHNEIPAAPAKSGQADKLAMYTCSMHPEVRQAGPGACPKCSMALEPGNVSL